MVSEGGGRGKTSSIKTGKESDDMGYNGFKISLCCKNIRMNIPLFIEMMRHWENLCLSPNHSSCSHVAVVFEGSGEPVLFLCDCVSGLVATIACCMGFFQWTWQRCNCTKCPMKSSVFLWHCSLPASAAEQADWCHSSGTLWAQAKRSLLLFLSPQVNNFAKCRPSSSIACRHSEFYPASNSCTTMKQVG